LALLTYSNRRIIFAAGLFFILSAFDGVLTLWGLNMNLITEANPIMRALISQSPRLFLALKFFVPALVGIYCWHKRNSDRKLVSYALNFAVGIYLLVSMFHIYWLVLYHSI